MSRQLLQQAAQEHTSIIEAQQASLALVLSRLQELRQVTDVDPMLAATEEAPA
jgi:hypothetical protein